MTQIDTFEIPTDLLDYLVNQADTDILLMQARSDKTLSQGFQPVKANIGHFRSRIRKRLAGQTEINEDTRLLLARAGFNYRFIVVLSERVLETFFDDLLTVCGYEAFLSGLLMDDRQSVRKQAIDYLEQKREVVKPAAKDIMAARTRLSDNLSVFLDAVGMYFNYEMPVDIPAQNAESSDELLKAEQQIQQLNNEIREIRAEAKKAKALQKKYDAQDMRINNLEVEKSALQVSLKAAQQECRQLVDQCKKSREEKEFLENSVGELILKGIEDEKQRLIHTWLKEPLTAAEVVEDAKSVTALVEMTDLVLSRQAEVDKHSGNLRVIHHQLETLAHAYQRVCDARRNALNPVPELQQVQQQLAQKMEELQSVLPNIPEKPDHFVDSLLGRISTAVSENEMADILELLNHVEAYGLLERKSLKELHIAHQTRMSRLYAASWPNVVQGPIPKNPVLKLRKFISENRTMLWLLDGCNILFGLDGELHIAHDLQTAREQLVDQVAGLVAQADRCLVRIYFDSPERTDITCAPNVKVVYSGGGHTDQRADNAVLTFLEYARNENADIPIFLTTDDRDFSTQARQLGVDIIRLQPFAALLADVARS